MKAKGKIILSSIALVLVVTLAIVAVFALTQTSTSSSFKVNFIGTRNVKATISAKSKLSNSDTIIETPTSVTFDGTSSDTATKTINFETEITIPSTDVSADYIFEIYNNLTDADAAELIVEPSVEENGLTDATITTYYQTNTANEYLKFSGTYTYATLAKDQAIRFKVSVKINDGVTNDVTITNAKISFKLYTHSTAPSIADGSNLQVDVSNLSIYNVGDKLIYGEYPQTYVGNTLNAILKGASSTELVETGKTYTVYYLDYDNHEQVDTQIKEYLYNGEKYVKFVGQQTDAFASGEAINRGETYFFKVEPIIFTVMETSNGRATVLADKLISFKTFSWASKPGWKDSELRSYMNGAFATDTGLADIALSSVIDTKGYVFFRYDQSGGSANSVSGEAPVVVADSDDTMVTDKLYVPSYDEANTWFQSDAERVAEATDFARVTGISQTYGSWWLRTANDIADLPQANFVMGSGEIYDEQVSRYTLVRCAMQIKA